MTEIVLKTPHLDLKTCLETFKTDPFSLETFLKIREKVLKDEIEKQNGDYIGIITIVIREMFTDLLRQAFTIFPKEKDVIFRFINSFMFLLLVNLRELLIKSHPNRQELTQMWYTTVLAGESLQTFSADFSPFFDDIFSDKMLEIIKKELEEHLIESAVIELKDEDGEIRIDGKYDLKTTIQLNSVVDVVNNLRLCPPNEKLNENVRQMIQNDLILHEKIKKFALNQIY